MSNFDPYYIWLGIPPEEQPPNYYRLLGIKPFEGSADVIQNAVDRQMVHLRTFQLGQHRSDSERLLNEVAAAKVCLLTPDRKTAYDASLRTSFAARQTIPVRPQPGIPSPSAAVSAERPLSPPADTNAQPVPGFDFEIRGPESKRSTQSRRSSRPTWYQHSWVLPAGIAFAVLLLIGIAAGWISTQAKAPARSDESQVATDSRPNPSADRPLPEEYVRVALLWPSPDRKQASLIIDGRPLQLTRDALKTTPSHLELALSPGEHKVRVEWDDGGRFEQTIRAEQGTVTRVSVERQSQPMENLFVDRRPVLSKAIAGNGLIARYYRDKEFQDLVVERVDSNVHFFWDRESPADGVPAESFSVSWEGFVKAPRAGRYTLAADADDRLQVWIDGQEVVTVDCDQQSADVELTDRPHAISVRLAQDKSSAHAAVCWSLPGVYTQQAIPTEALFTDRTLAEQTTVPMSAMHLVPKAKPTDFQSGQPVDLLALIDPARDTVNGMWWFDQSKLVSSRRIQEPHGDGKNCSIRIPVAFPHASNYRITAVVERCIADDCMRFYLPTKRGAPHFLVDGWPLEGWKSALVNVPGDHRSDGLKLPQGQVCTLVSEVRDDGIRVLLDGKPLLEWRGDWNSVPEHDPHQQLQFDAYDSIFRIHKLTWEPLGADQQLTASQLPADPALMMTFEGDTIFTKDGKRYIRDLSGNERHAEFVGGGVVLYNGMAGQAVEFNGTTRARLGQTVRDDFTISFWIKTVQPAKPSRRWYDGIGLIDADIEWSNNDFGVSLVDGRLACGIGNPDTTLSATSVLNDGKWHHCCVSRSSTSGEVRLYIDGRLEKSDTLTKGPRTVTDTALGEIQGGYNRYDGWMDELAIFSRVLSHSEIQAIYAHGKAGRQLSAPASTNKAENDVRAGNEFALMPKATRVLKYDPQDAWIRFSPDGRLLACNSSRGIELWDIQEDRIVRTLRHAHPGREVDFDFTPDGRGLIAARGNILMGWEVATGKQLFRDESLEAQPPVVISPDGKWLAAGGFNNDTATRFLQIIDLATMRRLEAIPVETSPLGSCVAFSPDSRRLAVGVNSGKNDRRAPGGGVMFEPVNYIEIRSVPSLRLLKKTEALTEGFFSHVMFSADGRRVVGDLIGTRYEYDAATGRNIPVERYPTGGTSFYSRRTELVAVVGIEGKRELFAVWHPDGAVTARWWPDRPENSSLQIDPRGQRLAVWDRGAKEICIYPLPQRQKQADSQEPSANAGTSPDVPDELRRLGCYEGRSSDHKAALLKLYGGNAASEEALARALAWLAKTQHSDGSWSLDQRSGGSGGGSLANASNGATGLALLAFLGAGQTHEDGKYKEVVRKGLRYLLKSGKLTEHGLSFHETDGTMYSHALATLAICEAYSMTDDASLYKPMRAAVSYTLYAQDPRRGGWRYTPREPGDTSVTGWQVAVLHAYRQTAPRPEDQRLLNQAEVGANAFLNAVQTDAGAAYGYDPERSEAKLPLTAAGLASRVYLGWTFDNPALKRGMAILDRAGPDLDDLYYTYYGTQVARNAGGDVWSRWNERFRDRLIREQVRTGADAGSWYLGADSIAVSKGGRHFCTCIAAMLLESYYRQMPIYEEGWIPPPIAAK